MVIEQLRKLKQTNEKRKIKHLTAKNDQISTNVDQSKKASVANNSPRLDRRKAPQAKKVEKQVRLYSLVDLSKHCVTSLQKALAAF